MSQNKQIAAFVIAATVVGGATWIGWRLISGNKNLTPTVIVPTPSITATTTPTTDTSTPTKFIDVTSVPSGLFNYGGSTTWAPIRKEVDVQIFAAHPNFRLRYTDSVGRTPGSGTGIKMLIEKQLSFSQSSRPLNEKETKEASQRNLQLEEIDVAIDGIAVAVHPDLQIPGITIAQLRDIYLGTIRNWKKIGGPDLPITPYSRRLEDGGTIEFFYETVLQKKNFGKNVQFVYSTTPGITAVSQKLGGIYYASAPELVKQCTIKTLPIAGTTGQFIAPYQEPLVPLSQCPNQRNIVNKSAFKDGSYPITRKLFVIVRDDNSTDEKAGRTYAKLLLTNQGQKLIDQAGFLPIR